jgi:plastocyanin
MHRITKAPHGIVALSLALGFAMLGTNHVGGAADVRIIRMNDQCEPKSFNAAFGAGTCVRANGGVSLDTFLRVLGHAGKIGSWSFVPGAVHVQEGQEFQAVNRGGEVHTFTEVDEFGGGFVPLLNELTGNPNTVPECALATLGPGDFIPPGGATEPEDEAPGIHHYQCCIHPWMRADVIVR